MEVSMTPSTAPCSGRGASVHADLARYRKWFTAYETNKQFEINEQLVHEGYYNSTGTGQGRSPEAQEARSGADLR